MSVEITNLIGSTTGYQNTIEVTGYFNAHPAPRVSGEGLVEVQSTASYSGGAHYDTTEFSKKVFVRTPDELLPIGEFADFAAEKQVPTRRELTRLGGAILATLPATEENVVSEEAKTPVLAGTAA